MSDRYLIISSDCHAGLKCEEYRPYLEAKYHPQFDAFLAEREARRGEALKMNYDYITHWETEHEEGLRGAHVRVPLQTVVLRRPDSVEADLLGVHGLCDRVQHDLALVRRARIVHLGFEEDRESQSGLRGLGE